MAARCSLWRCGVACGDLDEGLCASIARRRRLQTAWRVRLGVALLGGGGLSCCCRAGLRVPGAGTRTSSARKAEPISSPPSRCCATGNLECTVCARLIRPGLGQGCSDSTYLVPVLNWTEKGVLEEGNFSLSSEIKLGRIKLENETRTSQVPCTTCFSAGRRSSPRWY